VERKRFAVEQIVAVLKQAEARLPVAELIRQVGISTACRNGGRFPLCLGSAVVAGNSVVLRSQRIRETRIVWRRSLLNSLPSPTSETNTGPTKTCARCRASCL
jgi:hypothetical protein